MIDQATDIPEGKLRQAGVSVARKQRFAGFPQRLMGVHAAAVVAKNRLGHEGNGFALAVGHVLHDIFVEQHLVRRPHQRVELQINFRLAAGGHFVMMALHLHAAILHGEHHLGAQVLIVVGGRHGKVAFPEARPVSQIFLFPAGVPAALFGVDIVKAVLLALIEAHIVEDKKFGLGAEVGRVGNAGCGQMDLGFARDVTGIAVVALFRYGIDHIAYQHQGWHFGEGIE